MSNTIIIVLVSTVFTLTLSEPSVACGESLFRIGKGVHYRAYSAPIPGTVLVYAPDDAEREIAEQLRKAGHEVHVVDNDAGLAVEMQNVQFDVVVAPVNKQELVEAQFQATNSGPDWLPIVDHGAKPRDIAGTRQLPALSLDDDIRKYLKAIQKSIKRRET